MSTVTIKAKHENLPKVIEMLNKELDGVGCSMGTSMQLEMALEEIFVNICNYAYGEGEGDARIDIETLKNPLSVKIVFTDSGVKYNPLEKEDPDINLPIEQRQIGGLGIFMVKKTMDEMKYEYNDGKNILTIKKLIK